MSLFEYIDRMEESRSIMAYGGVGLLAFVLIFIIIKMLIGMRRGLWHQLISTGSTLMSALITYFASMNLDGIMSEKLGQPLTNKIITLAEEARPGAGEKIGEFIASTGDGFISRILSVPAALIVAPFLMVILFIVIDLILKIVVSVVVKIFNIHKAKDTPDRLYGVFISVVESVIILCVVLIPASGLIGIADEVYSDAINHAPDTERYEMKAAYEENISPLADNPVFTFVNKLGSENAYKKLAVVKSQNTKIDVRREALDITHLILIDAPELYDADFAALTYGEKLAIDNIVNGICDSEYLSELFVKLFNGAAVAIDKGIIELNIGGEYTALYNDTITFLSTISDDSLKEDIDTVKSIYFTISDSGIIGAMNDGDDIMELLQEKRKNGDDTVTKIVAILKNNKRTSMMVTSMTEALISTLSTQVDLGDDVSVTYDELKNDMTNVLSIKKKDYDGNEDAYIEALSTTLDETFKSHGMEIEKEIVDDIAKYVGDEYGDKEDLTDEEFNDVLLHYYDAYLEYLESGEVPDEFEDKINSDEDTKDSNSDK